MSPLWRKAPLLLVRYPALFGAMAIAALLLALASASSPLFLSSAGASALRNQLTDATRFGGGASVEFEDVPSRLEPGLAGAAQRIELARKQLRGALSGVSHVGRPVVTVLGATTGRLNAPGETFLQVRLLARTGALDHVTKLSGNERGGFWVSDEAARALGIGPGEEIRLTPQTSGKPVRVRIDGVYRALWKETPKAYWRSLTGQIYETGPSVGPSSPEESGPPPTFLIGDPAQIVRVSTTLGLDRFRARWEWPLNSIELSLREAERVERRFGQLRTVVEGLSQPVPIRQQCEGCPSIAAPHVSYSSLLPLAIGEARETRAVLRGPAELLATAGSAVALAVIVAAAWFVVARRRVEVRLLFTRGHHPAAFGARLAVESILPLAAGTGAGIGVALLLVRLIGPSPILESEALADGWIAAAVRVPAAALLLAVVAITIFFRQEPGRRRLRRLGVVPWEVVPLAVSAFLLVRLFSGNAVEATAGEVTRPGAELLLFPIFAIGGLGGLAARGLGPLLRALRPHAGRIRSAAGYLALIRLAGAKQLVVLLVSAAALSLGVFVYAQSVVSSYSATVRAKVLLFVGSDVQGTIGQGTETPRSLAYPVTKVARLYEAGELASTGRIDLLGVDPATFARAAYWDDRYAAVPLPRLMEKLTTERDGRLPILVVAGNSTDLSTLILSRERIAVRVVGRADAFPGMSRRRPLVVVSSAELRRFRPHANPLDRPSAFTELWVKGPTEAAKRELLASDAHPFPVLTAQDAADDPSITAFTNTFAFLKALGIAAAFLSVVGTVLYLQARQRGRTIAFQLARRMGLARTSHISALALELAAMLGFALVIGAAIALAAGKLIMTRVEPLASISPLPLFTVPGAALGVAGGALLAAAVVGAFLADTVAERENLARLMRTGE